MNCNAWIVLACALVCASPTSTLASESGAAPAPLTLRDCIERALSRNAGRRAREVERKGSLARLEQARSRVNPELGLDFENLAGGRDDAASTEATLSIGQLWELGGKRSARVAVANAEREVLERDLDGERLVLVGEVTARFIEALAAGRAEALTAEEVNAAEQAAATTAQRVTAGAAHPVERRRAEVELANLKLERAILASNTALAHARLALLWGDSEPGFTGLDGEWDALPRVVSLDTLALRAEGSPTLARWSAEARARARRGALERARRVPDLHARLGVRTQGGASDPSFVAGVSLPLPMFDRNRGAIQAASASEEQAAFETANARIELRRALAESHATLRVASITLETLRRDVLPGAQLAFDEMRLGFERGRFTYLDLLEARRTWLRARREELQAKLAAHLAVAELERMLGAPLATGAPESPRPEGGRDR